MSVSRFHLHVGSTAHERWGAVGVGLQAMVQRAPERILSDAVIPVLESLGVPYWNIADGFDPAIKIVTDGDDGLEVMLEVGPPGLCVWTNTLFHAMFDAGSVDDVEAGLGMVRDVLAGTVRVRERRAGELPYRADLQVLKGGLWKWGPSVCLLRFPYFARRSECVRSNAFPV